MDKEDKVAKGIRVFKSGSDIFKFFNDDFDMEPRIISSSLDDRAGRSKRFNGHVKEVLVTPIGIYVKVISEVSKLRIPIPKDNTNKHYTRGSDVPEHKYILGRCVTIIPLHVIDNIYTVKTIKDKAVLIKKDPNDEEVIDDGEDVELEHLDEDFVGEDSSSEGG